MLMNVFCMYKATNACISELLHLFWTVILRSPNSLPTNEGTATSMLGQLGLKYNTLDECKNECVLFKKDYAEIDTYPRCQALQYKRAGMSNVPNKVLKHFPFIPHLRRMFSTPQLAALMMGHASNI